MGVAEEARFLRPVRRSRTVSEKRRNAGLTLVPVICPRKTLPVQAGVLANRFDVDDFVDGFASGGNAKSQHWRAFQR
jgi:hypothetical protein